MKKYFPLILLATITLIPITFGFLSRKKEPIICNHTYALCTSAQCIPDPQNSSQTICFCSVHMGESVGYTSCQARLPKTDEFNVTHLISTFSFDEFATKNVMTCPNGTPWSYCLDQPCIVDPMNPDKAICKCKLYTKGAIRTLGGHCNTKTCKTGFWSGATPQSNEENVKSLSEALQLEKTPGKHCPQ